MSDYIFRSVMIGVLATAIYDLWGLVLVKFFGLPGSNWTLAGRWFCHMADGVFRHQDIRLATSVGYETAVGWSMHYIVGIIYAGLLLALCGSEWGRNPTLIPALLLGIITILAGWLVMAPAMGLGVAGADLPNVGVIRIVQFIGHCVFGLGLYLAATVIKSALR